MNEKQIAEIRARAEAAVETGNSLDTTACPDIDAHADILDLLDALEAANKRIEELELRVSWGE